MYILKGLTYLRMSKLYSQVMREPTVPLLLRCCYAVARHYNSEVIMSNTSPQTVRVNALAVNVSNCTKLRPASFCS